VTRGVVGLLRLHPVVDHVVGDVDHRLVGIGAYGGTCVVLAHWILCMERGTGYFARAPFRKPRSAFVGVRPLTLRRLFCPPPCERAPGAGPWLACAAPCARAKAPQSCRPPQNAMPCQRDDPVDDFGSSIAGRRNGARSPT